MPKGMIEYARNDSHFLIAIYLVLIKMVCPSSFESTEQELFLSKDLVELSCKSPNDWLTNLTEIDQKQPSLQEDLLKFIASQLKNVAQ